MLAIPVKVCLSDTQNHASMQPDTYVEVQTYNICQKMRYSFICVDKIVRLKF